MIKVKILCRYHRQVKRIMSIRQYDSKINNTYFNVKLDKKYGKIQYLFLAPSIVDNFPYACET